MHGRCLSIVCSCVHVVAPNKPTTSAPTHAGHPARDTAR